MTKVLVIDNYDSFVYTLNGYLQQLGAETEVVRNDTLTVEDLAEALSTVDAVLVSPGPGTPAQAGISLELIRYAAEISKPLLGVCLGHQAIAETFGGTVEVAAELMHGKTSELRHDNSLLFDEVANPFIATRYHSLAVKNGTVPDVLTVTAQTDNGVIMALQHKSKPIYGVQFHPESVLTEGGYQMLGNWLESLGLQGAKARARTLSPGMVTTD
ncbi:MAG: aminodeoxychorismate/anthranilate synthase component II [Microbacteriaceae bacterium]